MPVFISHSFQDKPEFDNIADALELKNIEYWKPESLRAGASLAEQLRRSILEAEVCVFVATRNSVESAWCGAELGAFWGAGKPVLIYIAEATLPEDELPKQFQGHLTERRISRVVQSVQTFLAEAEKERVAVAQTSQPSQAAQPSQASVVGAMTAEELKLLIVEAINRTQDAGFVEATLTRIASLIRNQNFAEDSPDYRELRDLLSSLLSVSATAVREGAKRATDWRHSFSFLTETGQWLALALRTEDHSDYRAPISYYKDCVVLRFGPGERVEAVAQVETLTDHDTLGIVQASTPTLTVGRGTLGAIPQGINR